VGYATHPTRQAEYAEKEYETCFRIASDNNKLPILPYTIIYPYHWEFSAFKTLKGKIRRLDFRL